MFRRTGFFLTLFALFVLIFPTAVLAQQVVPDPDKIGILDKATGKEWLPISYTSFGFTFNQVYPVVVLPAHPEITGYRLAAQSEVSQLFNDAGFPAFSYFTSPTTGIGYYESDVYDSGTTANAFIALFGVQVSTIVGVLTGSITGWSLPDNFPGVVNGMVTLSNEDITSYYGLSQALYVPNYLTYGIQYSWPDTNGFFLVKDAVSITSPYNFAEPQSSYVALTGKGPANATVEILVDGVGNLHTFENTTAKVDADGDWEKVVYVGRGDHLLKAEDITDTTDVSKTVIVDASPPLSQPRTTTDYTLLQKADIFLTRGYASPQIAYFGIPTTGFQYTHTALYLGGDFNGTPTVAEAVTAAEGGSYGAVRAVPLEVSTVWTDGTSVDIYRPITPLSKGQRSAVVGWAQGVTNKGIPYWAGLGDFGLFYKAWDQWNPILDKPSSFLFQNALNGLDARKNATDRFICSTLVWHSYYAGTGTSVDLSLPNNATPQAVIGSLITTKLLHTLQPHFVFPDTLARDGKLAKVN